MIFTYKRQNTCQKFRKSFGSLSSLIKNHCGILTASTLSVIFDMNSVNSKKPIQRPSRKRIQKGQKRKYEKSSSRSRKTKDMKRTKQKTRKSSRLLNEYAEYESSRFDLRRNTHQGVPKIPSDNSVIYVKTYPQKESMIPVIDLTQSSHSILYSSVSSKRFPSSTSLKLIYKSNNFNKLHKHFTTSLLTIPLTRQLPVDTTRGVNSTSNLTRCSREKLSILDVPPEYFDEDTDGSEYAFYDLSKADLTEEDMSMVDCIMMKEDDDSHSSYSLDAKQPIENMCKMYGVTSTDSFE